MRPFSLTLSILCNDDTGFRCIYGCKCQQPYMQILVGVYIQTCVIRVHTPGIENIGMIFRFQSNFGLRNFSSVKQIFLELLRKSFWLRKFSVLTLGVVATLKARPIEKYQPKQRDCYLLTYQMVRFEDSPFKRPVTRREAASAYFARSALIVTPDCTSWVCAFTSVSVPMDACLSCIKE